MTIRSTLTLIAVAFCVLGIDNLAPDPTSAQSQNIETSANRDESPVKKPSVKTDRQSQYTSFPTAGVQLIQPTGFTPAESFEGFQQPSTQSSVMVVKLPGPFAAVTSGFTANGLKTRGMTLKSKKDVKIDGNKGILLSLIQTAYDIEFAKWIVVFGDDKETKIVTATFPNSRSAKLSAQLKSAVLTAKNDPTPPPALGSNVGFTIAASDKVKLTSGIGKMLLYTKDGVIPAKSPADPLFIVAPSFSQISIADKQQFATRRLYQTAHTKITAVTTTTPISIDGLDGYEIVADAQDASSGTPLAMYQVMLFDNNRSYILIQGLVGANVRAEYLPEFRAMARSFKKQRNPTKTGSAQ
jgi:hypothetical protein